MRPACDAIYRQTVAITKASSHHLHFVGKTAIISTKICSACRFFPKGMLKSPLMFRFIRLPRPMNRKGSLPPRKVFKCTHGADRQTMNILPKSHSRCTLYKYIVSFGLEEHKKSLTLPIIFY